MRYLKIYLAILILGLSACDVSQNPAVKNCNARCASNPSLQSLSSKVMYKPIKLCKKRCAQTEGTCMKKGAKVANYRACIYYGMNAGSMTPRTGGLLKLR